MRRDLGINPADDRFDRFTDDGAAIALATGRRSAAAGPDDCDATHAITPLGAGAPIAFGLRGHGSM